MTTAPVALERPRRPRVPGLVRFVARRLAALVLLSLGITTVTFVLTQLVPSNAAATNLGEQAAGDPAAVATFKHHYGRNGRCGRGTRSTSTTSCTVTSDSRRSRTTR